MEHIDQRRAGVVPVRHARRVQPILQPQGRNVSKEEQLVAVDQRLDEDAAVIARRVVAEVGHVVGDTAH